MNLFTAPQVIINEDTHPRIAQTLAGLRGWTLEETARRTADTVQGSAEMARTNAQDVSARGFEFAEQNVTAAFDLAQKLVRSRDLQEAMQHQAEFVRSQFAAIQAQAKEFGGLAQSAMQQSAEKAKGAMQEGAEHARKAMEQGSEAARKAGSDAEQAMRDGRTDLP